MAEGSEDKRSSDTQRVPSPYARHSPMAEGGEQWSGSDTEWTTIYSRIAIRQSQTGQQPFATNMREDTSNDKPISAEPKTTASKGTQSDPYETPLEKLRTMGQEFSRLSDETPHIDATKMFQPFTQLVHTVLDPIGNTAGDDADMEIDADKIMLSNNDLFSGIRQLIDTVFTQNGITAEDVHDGLSQLLRENIDQAIARNENHNAKRVSHSDEKSTIGTQQTDELNTAPAVSGSVPIAKDPFLVDGRITRNETSTDQLTCKRNMQGVASNNISVSGKPRSTASTDTQTEPCDPYDISDENLRTITQQCFRLIYKFKDMDINHFVDCDEFFNKWLDLMGRTPGQYVGSFMGLLSTFVDEFVTDIERLVESDESNATQATMEIKQMTEQENFIQKMQEDTGNETPVSADPTVNTTSEMTSDDIPETTLRAIAQEIAQGLDLYTDAEKNTLFNIRLVLECDQRNVKLVDVIGITPGDCAVMETEPETNSGGGVRNNNEEHTESKLLKLIRHVIDQGCHHNASRDSDSDGSGTQSTTGTQRTDRFEKASVETCAVMAYLGYGPHFRQVRRKYYRKFARSIAMFGFATFLITGSKAEGLTCIFENDRDFLIVLNIVLCIEDGTDASVQPRNKTLFKMQTHRCYPGHCRLMLASGDFGLMLFTEALCKDESGDYMLSSDLFVKHVSKFFLRLHNNAIMYHSRAGPSMPMSEGYFHSDRVVALRCHCPSILQRWAERPRHWPPPDIVKKVVSLGAIVTPVGFNGSEYKHVEWRICFNNAETELVQSLNDTQVYIYVMLKMVVKDVLKPCKKEITSYMLKNIVLWLAEKNPHTLFYDRCLFNWLHEGLGELRAVISSKQLSYYMIPERNLMAACGMEDVQQRIWVATITEMMYEGPRIILRLNKIRQAVLSHPEPLLWYSKRRTELEILVLEEQSRIATRIVTATLGLDHNSNSIMHELRMRIYEILREVRQRLDLEGIWFYDLNELFVRMMR